MPPQSPNARAAGGGAQDPRAHEEARRSDRARQEQIADTVAELEESVEQLRTRYELYFVGVERREPNREREEMKRAIARIKGESTTVNIGLRFRIDTLHARFLSYERMWLRSARQKEEGTYRRDIERMRRRGRRHEPQRKKGAAEQAVEGPPPGSPPSSAERPKVTAPAGAAARKDPPRSAVATKGAGGLSAEQLEALYGAYVDAKKRCGEDVSRITYDALAKTVARQVPELLVRYKAKTVEFKVLIKDGKALLKAVPKG